MTKTFYTRQRLRFAHCDPAGIAYYPRYLELCDGVVEDWCEQVLEVPRSMLHLDLGLGLPTVQMEARFVAPSRMGDWIDFALEVTSLGHTSVGFQIDASSLDERRFSIVYAQVLINLKSGRPVAWPEDWRARIEPLVRS